MCSPQHNVTPRHRGAEGGWENQIPSNDPKSEVVIILSILDLVGKCERLVYSTSGFADELSRAMGEGAERINLDDGLSEDEIYNEKHFIDKNAKKG